MSLRITGKLPTGKLLEKIKKSPNYRNGSFQNLSPTPMKQEGVPYWKMMKEFFKKHPETAPISKLPFVKTELKKLSSSETSIVWFGHSSYLVRTAGKNFLVDPVLSGNAAPVSFMVRAFPGSDEYKADDMPEIDYLVLTHDHYDHLDFKTIRKLRKNIKQIYCSLGLSSHLIYWGVEKERITELDWWDTAQLDDGITLMAAPARHFSGRGLKRGQCLWSSFILKTGDHNIYLGGDSGYDTHFKEIGNKYGPFDITILEAGQYNVMWPFIHMMPEETVQAAKDLKAKILLPVHWGKFRLGMHPWNEPIKRVLQKAEELDIDVISPMIGQVYTLSGKKLKEKWWEINKSNHV